MKLFLTGYCFCILTSARPLLPGPRRNETVLKAANVVYGVWAKYRTELTGREALSVLLERKKLEVGWLSCESLSACCHLWMYVCSRFTLYLAARLACSMQVMLGGDAMQLTNWLDSLVAQRECAWCCMHEQHLFSQRKRQSCACAWPACVPPYRARAAVGTLRA